MLFCEKYILLCLAGPIPKRRGSQFCTSRNDNAQRWYSQYSTIVPQYHKQHRGLSDTPRSLLNTFLHSRPCQIVHIVALFWVDFPSEIPEIPRPFPPINISPFHRSILNPFLLLSPSHHEPTTSSNSIQLPNLLQLFQLSNS